MRNRDEALDVERAGMKKRNVRLTSKRVPRTLVVWETSVTSARSWSNAGILSTRQGRTFAANPKSTIHTSPRRGSATPGLFLVQLQENVICRLKKRFFLQRW